MTDAVRNSDGTCCQPARSAGVRGGGGATAATAAQGPQAALRAACAAVPGGTAVLGTATPWFPDDGEGPLRTRRIKPFLMARTAATNREFGAFVAATNYVTEAERFGWSFVFWAQVPERLGPQLGVQGVEWWRRVDGATWQAPNGPGTEADCHPDHPVVHVSWNDARAFAAWAGGRLPTEAEWEHAARGGLGDVPFPWGHAEPDDDDHQPCNIWQGRFPETNLCRDGHAATAPAESFAPNGYGLFNMVGNVWEWTADPFVVRSQKRAVKARLAGMKGWKLTKGGSFLCHKSYCFRYRIAARTGNSPDSTTTHQGFRLVFDTAPAAG